MTVMQKTLSSGFFPVVLLGGLCFGLYVGGPEEGVFPVVLLDVLIMRKGITDVSTRTKI
tara:strand:+ start:334 stop:510 length:177 start_codon:yes stop_codon:yes gene_type:complete